MAFVTKHNNDSREMAEEDAPGTSDESAGKKRPGGSDEPGGKAADKSTGNWRGNKAPVVPKRPTGYFSIYKRGQGYWTRMGTVGAAVLIAALTGNFLRQYVPIWVPQGWSKIDLNSLFKIPYTGWLSMSVTTAVTAGVISLFAVLFAWWVWHLMNKPTNADFMIATDSEMKKVNWTTRQELIGSTKVVIAFMFLIAIYLFLFDRVFGYLFYWIHVLRAPF